MTDNSDHLRHADDRRLVQTFLRQRSETVFRRLYRRYTPNLYQIVLRILGGNQQETDEVVQDTWVRAVENLHEFRWQSSLRTWLTGIAVRRCQEQFRHRKHARKHDLLDDNRADDQPNADDRLDLERAIAAMPDGYRQILVLHDIEGYTHGEIAELLQIQTGTSKSQLFQARKAMRNKLRTYSKT